MTLLPWSIEQKGAVVVCLAYKKKEERLNWMCDYHDESLIEFYLSIGKYK